MREKPEVGQTVYRLPVGNAARREAKVLTPVTVKKVGRKYFCAGDGCFERQYHIDDWTENSGDYIADYRLFASEQEYADEMERGELFGEIRAVFERGGRRNISLQVLRDIKAAIESCG